MRKIEPLGFWVPDGPTSGNVTRYSEEYQLPLYNMQAAQACIDACGDRLGTAIDGGAYIGTFSAHLVQHFSRVLAFEPIAPNYECLRLNVPGAEAYWEALSDKTALMFMQQPEFGWKTYQWRMSDVPWGTMVLGRAIDDLGLTELSLLKLDVEGHEYEALRGGQATLVAYRPVVLIEEKPDLDPDERAAEFLTGLGMRRERVCEFDHLFTWS